MRILRYVGPGPPKCAGAVTSASTGGLNVRAATSSAVVEAEQYVLDPNSMRERRRRHDEGQQPRDRDAGSPE